jgi:hypothetical protein
MKIKANNIDEFFNNSNEHKELLIILDNIIGETVPNLKRDLYISDSITLLGYGAGLFKDDKYKDYPIISIAPQKHVVSVYIMAYNDKISVVEAYKDKLGKVSCGLGCIRIKKLENLNIEEFKHMLKDSVLWNRG